MNVSTKNVFKDRNIDGEDCAMIPEQAKLAQKRNRRTHGKVLVRL